MFNPTNEVIKKVILGYEKKGYDVFFSDKIENYLKTLDNTVVKTLSGKEVPIKISYDFAGNLTINTDKDTINVAVSEFNLFCESFPYNKDICFDDLQDILKCKETFPGGFLPPKLLLASPRSKGAIEQVDLFYGIALAWINEEIL